jgi:hypothetical protein
VFPVRYELGVYMLYHLDKMNASISSLVCSLDASIDPTGHHNAGFLIFLCFQANAEMVPKFQVATANLSCSLPALNSTKLNSVLWRPHFPPNYTN